MNYEKAASYWEEKDAASVRMSRDALQAEMQKFIEKHTTCALATAYGDFVRCTPIEYSFKDGMFWMFSEGGLKFHALKHNKNVCLAIYDSYSGFANLAGMPVTGTAKIVEPEAKEYSEMLKFKNIPAENLKKLGHEIHLICVTLVQIDFLWSGFKKMGCDTRQFLTF